MAKLPIPFSNPKTYAGHSGVDYGQPRGTAIPASGPGRVQTLSKNAAGGYFIWVKYDNGPLVGYHHMDSHRGCPPVGTRVSEGTRLGYVGSTGNSTGPHLHSEVSGHRTTAGYWQFFDRNRIVGSKPAGGGGTPIPSAPSKPTPPTTNPQLENNNMMMIHWTETTWIKPGKAGEYNAISGERRHYMVFGDSLIVDELYADAYSGTQPTADAYSKQCGGPSVLVTKAKYDEVRGRVVTNAGSASVTLDNAALAKAVSDAVKAALSTVAFPTAEAIGKASVKALADELND